MANCYIHLLNLDPSASLSTFLESLDSDLEKSVLIRGKPHGWVHEPHKFNLKQLTPNSNKEDIWDLLLLTTTTTVIPPHSFSQHPQIHTHLSIPISIPTAQLTNLITRATTNSKPTPSPLTPPLPPQWFTSPNTGTIPSSLIVPSTPPPLRPGQLLLDKPMSTFLSTALPLSVSNAPVCYFNLFKYAHGDRTVHDAYMDGFKECFGSAAGAQVLFMGGVEGPLRVNGEEMEVNREGRWDDANLVQYDSVWHYAYMLSTRVYQGLNQTKMEGLQDTCILLVGEWELVDG